MERGIVLLVGVLYGVFLLSFVSAGLFYSQLDSTYNLGDIVQLEVSVEPVIEGRFVRVILECDGDDIITFNRLPEGGLVTIVLPLNVNTIEGAGGTCLFSGSYEGDTRISEGFEISRRLNVVLDSDTFFIRPGEEVIISGTAQRLNGVGISGEVEISIPLLQLMQSSTVNIKETDEEDEETDEGEESDEGVVEEDTEEEIEEEEVVVVDGESAGVYYGTVSDGDFFVSIILNEDVPAGDYRIDVLAFEGASHERLSEGIAMADLHVFQILTSAELALNTKNIDPGQIFEFKPLLKDQTGSPISDDVSIIIRNEANERTYEKIVKSDETATYSIPSNFSAGYYTLEISNGEVSASDQFYVNEKAIATFELLNGTLHVINIGNIPYTKDIEISLNGKPFVRKVSLGLGESTSFELTGVGSEYDISVSDGESAYSKGGVVLTGRVVDVTEEGNSSFTLGPVFWLFLIILLLASLLFFFRNSLKDFKKSSIAYPFRSLKKVSSMSTVAAVPVGTQEKKETSPVSVQNALKSSEHLVPIPEPTPSHKILEAEQALVSHGHKYVVAVITLKIKNKLNNFSKQSLAHMMDIAYKNQGAIFEQGDYLFLLFNPLLTKVHKNESRAARVAHHIQLLLKANNQKFKEKIEFGISVHSGEMISKIENGKLKFTALGNMMGVGKRLSESSDSAILITQPAYERGGSEIKAEKNKVEGSDVYMLRTVMDHEDHSKFIKGFLKRMEDYKL